MAKKLKPCPLIGPFRVKEVIGDFGRAFAETSVLDGRDIPIIRGLPPDAAMWVSDALNTAWNRRAK